MKRPSVIRHIALIGIALMGMQAAAATPEETTRRQRNFNHNGCELYKQKRYADAEVAFSKALELNPSSEVTNYNYAMSLLNQAQPSDKGAENSPLATALERLNGLIDADNDMIAELAAYNLGNVEFGNENYRGAIEYYKRSLMRNPDNDQARENLRLAQIKLKEQQDQQQDQNQDQDKNQDQQDQQDKQDQQDQNKDQQDQQNQDQNQNQNNQDQNQNQQQQDQQPQPQQPQGISAANAQKILDTVEKAEAATRAKVDAEKKKEDHQIYGRPKGNQW